MTKRIITISREFGSGGRFIGEEVAKKLGIKYYDKEIIGQIAKESGMAPEYIKENAELSPKKGIFAYAFTGRDITGKSVEDMVYEAQRKVILDLAEKEPCVIIGRNADYILKDRDDCLKIYIYAPFDVRTKHIAEKYDMSMFSAKRLVRQMDEKRDTYYKYVTGNRRGEHDGKDAMFDSSIMGVDGTVDMLLEMINKKFG